MRKLILILSIFLFHNSYSQWYQQVNPINKIIRHIDFVDSMKGWGQTKGDSSTDTSFVIRTTNGGTNWFVQYYQKGLNLDLIDFVNDSTGYLFGYSFNTHTSTMLKTTNGGVNWVETQLSFGLGFADCQFIDENTGFVCQFSPSGGMWKTTNGGVSWQSINSGIVGGGVNTMFFLNARNGWCGTAGLYYTTNGGANWTVSFSGSSQSVYKIFFSDSLHGWGAFGNMFYSRTTSGGANWIYQKLIPENSSPIVDVKFINGLTGWLIANGIYKSTTGGVSWGKQSLIPSPLYLGTNFAIADSSNLWIGGIYHTTNGGGTFTSIRQISNTISDNFTLYQNYPNPFNPKTTIRFSLKEISSFILSVYDLSGKLINKYNSNNVVSSGLYEIQFDASALSSGTYIYKLETFNSKTNVKYQESKKMMLIK